MKSVRKAPLFTTKDHLQGIVTLCLWFLCTCRFCAFHLRWQMTMSVTSLQPLTFGWEVYHQILWQFGLITLFLRYICCVLCQGNTVLEIWTGSKMVTPISWFMIHFYKNHFPSQIEHQFCWGKPGSWPLLNINIDTWSQHEVPTNMSCNEVWT